MSRMIKDKSKLSHFVQTSWGDVYYVESSNFLTELFYVGNQKGQLGWKPIESVQSKTEWQMFETHFNFVHNIDSVALMGIMEKGEIG